MKKPMTFALRRMAVFVVIYILIQSYYQVHIFNDGFRYCEGQDKPVGRHNMTLITAYFDLGSFRKGVHKTFETETYFRWLTAFKYILNPLIVYTDSENFARFFQYIRKNLMPKTKIIKVRRGNMWSFQISRKIKSIFLRANYPHFHPNTVYPEYSSVQHAKYELVANGIKTRLFPSTFYAWIDIGYFRDIVDSKIYSEMFSPPDIDETKIAVNKIYEFNPNLTISDIFKGNHVWVGGGLFIGTEQVLIKFEQIYKHAVYHFIDQGLMNTDQQILYSLYSYYGKRVFKPSIQLQLYTPNNYTQDPWFFLGYYCRVVSDC